MSEEEEAFTCFTGFTGFTGFAKLWSLFTVYPGQRGLDNILLRIFTAHIAHITDVTRITAELYTLDAEAAGAGLYVVRLLCAYCYSGTLLLILLVFLQSCTRR